MSAMAGPHPPAGRSSRDSGSASHPAGPLRDAIQLQAEATFSAVFDSSGEALLLVDREGMIRRANPRARELLRIKKHGSLRHELSDLFPGSSAGQLSRWWDRGASSVPIEGLDASLASGHPVRVTLRAILPDSEHMLLCIEEGSIVQRAEAKWREVEAELRSVLDAVEAGVVLLDRSGRVRFSNFRFGQLFGLNVGALGVIYDFAELEDLLAPRFRDPKAFTAPWQAFAAGGGEPGHDEIEITRPARRVIERFFRPVLDREGRSIGWLELYSDVTGERQIQSKMLQTEKMAALGQLVSGIAHELNNPLTAIMGYAQLLLGHGLLPGPFSEARKVYSQAERARRIVKNLLYFARENQPERTRVDLNEIVERTLALRSYELKVENIAVELDLAPELPPTMADPYQLQQVVLNLLINAEQSLLEVRGRGCVWIKTRLVHRTEDRILLEVSDDGCGVSPEIAWRIFDPFFTTKPAGVGTGLGLSIVYGIVHQHGGEVSYESRPGGGARFLVELPIVPVPADARTPVSPENAGPARAATTGRILVVEDEPTVAQLIADVLREEGHQVEAVLDSQEGLARLSRRHYDLVICDLRMPTLDGPAFYEALVHTGSPLEHRIIFVTGDMLAPRTQEFLRRHGLPYLAKPFLVEELKLAVNRALERGPNEKQGEKQDEKLAVSDSSPGARKS